MGGMTGYLVTIAAGVFAIILVVRLVMDGRRNGLAADSNGPHASIPWRIYLGAAIILAAGVPRIFPGSTNSDWAWMLSAVMYVVGLIVLLSGKRWEIPPPESGG